MRSGTAVAYAMLHILLAFDGVPWPDHKYVQLINRTIAYMMVVNSERRQESAVWICACNLAEIGVRQGCRRSW